MAYAPAGGTSSAGGGGGAGAGTGVERDTVATSESTTPALCTRGRASARRAGRASRPHAPSAVLVRPAGTACHRTGGGWQCRSPS